jgi:hypothetical protein
MTLDLALLKPGDIVKMTSGPYAGKVVRVGSRNTQGSPMILCKVMGENGWHLIQDSNECEPDSPTPNAQRPTPNADSEPSSKRPGRKAKA